ncbi:MAG: IclR family transcriptional regulator [Pseudomonadota bacterium]
MDGARAQIPTNLRLLAVLEEVARAGGAVTPTEVNARLDLPKATIHRLFATLATEGFLERDLDGRAYGPGPRLRGLAWGVLSAEGLRTARRAVLERLSREIGETCNIALPEGDAMVYLDRVETEWPLRIQLPPGTRVPLYCTASGKMFLTSLSAAQLERYAGSASLERRTPATITDAASLVAEVAEARALGRALDREEFMAGMFAVAAPVMHHGRLVGTLSVHAPVQRFDADRAEGCLPAIGGAARALSALMMPGEEG